MNQVCPLPMWYDLERTLLGCLSNLQSGVLAVISMEILGSWEYDANDFLHTLSLMLRVVLHEISTICNYAM
jgi:hypothetical protein